MDALLSVAINSCQYVLACLSVHSSGHTVLSSFDKRCSELVSVSKQSLCLGHLGKTNSSFPFGTLHQICCSVDCT